MKIEKKKITRVVEYEYNFTLNEEQALILTFILGKIGGIHLMRDLLVNPLYSELEKNIGTEKVYKFRVDNKNALESYMWFKKDE